MNGREVASSRSQATASDRRRRLVHNGRCGPSVATLAVAAFAFGYLASVYSRCRTSVPPHARTRHRRPSWNCGAQGQAAGRAPPSATGGSATADPPHLKRAVVVTEDAAFFDHDGIDLDEIKASLERNWEEGRFARGASTITQQLAKNLYLSPSRNPMRKLRELFITRRLEASLSKRRILEIYLNVIEWGDGVFGCEAAARAYFGKSAAALSREEAALMAGAIINPRELRVDRPNRRLQRRQQIVLRRMGPAADAPR